MHGNKQMVNVIHQGNNCSGMTRFSFGTPIHALRRWYTPGRSVRISEDIGFRCFWMYWTWSPLILVLL